MLNPQRENKINKPSNSRRATRILSQPKSPGTWSWSNHLYFPLFSSQGRRNRLVGGENLPGEELKSIFPGRKKSAGWETSCVKSRPRLQLKIHVVFKMADVARQVVSLWSMSSSPFSTFFIFINLLERRNVARVIEIQFRGAASRILNLNLWKRTLRDPGNRPTTLRGEPCMCARVSFEARDNEHCCTSRKPRLCQENEARGKVATLF